MSPWILLGAAAFAAYAGYHWQKRRALARRARFIDQLRLPKGIHQKIAKKYPHLSSEQIQLAEEGLKDYFHICNLAGARMVSMPSQVVDELWHEFILFTQTYQLFCKKAFGRFLHHTPAEAMISPAIAQTGIKRAWRLACAHEKINPKSPQQLPRLFALDQLLNIPDGFTYTLRCAAHSKAAQNAASGTVIYCASDISCTSSCGTGCSNAGCGGDSGCGGGCGGGD